MSALPLANETHSEAFTAAFDIIKRTKPERVALVLKSLLVIMQNNNVPESDIKKLMLYVPTLAKTVVNESTQQKYIGAAQNACGRSFRAPATQDYNMPITKEIKPSVHFPLEAEINRLYTTYGKQYTSTKSEFVASVFLSGDDPNIVNGAGFLLITPPSDMMTGQYQSSNFFSANISSKASTEIKNSTTIGLFLKTKDEGLGINTSLMGNLTISKSDVTKGKILMPALLSAIENCENSTLSTLKNIYFSRSKKLICEFRNQENVQLMAKKQKITKDFFAQAASPSNQQKE